MPKSNHAARSRSAVKERRAIPKQMRPQISALGRRMQGRRLTYLDAAATTQRLEPVLEAMSDYYHHDNGNSHQEVHELGKKSKETSDKARQTVADFLGAREKEEVVWVKGATEAINIVARTWAEENTGHGDNVVLTVTEHVSNLIPWQQLAKRTGVELRFIDVDALGRLRLEQLDKLISRRTKLVSLCQVSNVLGMINPVTDVVDAAKRVHARVLVDGAQSAPHFPIDVGSLGCDFFAFSAHKIGGPFGEGALWAKRELLARMTPHQFGGGAVEDATLRRHRFKSAPDSLEAGTGNPAGAEGFRAAIDVMNNLGRDQIWSYEQKLVEHGLERLASIDGLTLLGSAVPEERIPLFTFTYKKLDGTELAKRLARRGIAVSGGPLNAHPTLKRFGLDSATRASCWAYNTMQELDTLADALRGMRGD
jgi:cysteine desulfurase/selenocysteine lyase